MFRTRSLLSPDLVFTSTLWSSTPHQGWGVDGGHFPMIGLLCATPSPHSPLASCSDEMHRAFHHVWKRARISWEKTYDKGLEQQLRRLARTKFKNPLQFLHTHYRCETISWRVINAFVFWDHSSVSERKCYSSFISHLPSTAWLTSFSRSPLLSHFLRSYSPSHAHIQPFFPLNKWPAGSVGKAVAESPYPQSLPVQSSFPADWSLCFIGPAILGKKANEVEITSPKSLCAWTLHLVNEIKKNNDCVSATLLQPNSETPG